MSNTLNEFVHQKLLELLLILSMGGVSRSVSSSVIGTGHIVLRAAGAVILSS